VEASRGVGAAEDSPVVGGVGGHRWRENASAGEAVADAVGGRCCGRRLGCGHGGDAILFSGSDDVDDQYGRRDGGQGIRSPVQITEGVCNSFLLVGD